MDELRHCSSDRDPHLCVGKRKQCHKCALWICAFHNKRCLYCRTPYCEKCAPVCLATCTDECDDSIICDACMTPCYVCGQKTCKAHRVLCTVGNHYVCTYCLGGTDDNDDPPIEVCRKCCLLCIFCKSPLVLESMNPETAPRCKDCQAYMCSDHIAECSECEDYLCIRCFSLGGICDSCRARGS